MGKKIAYGKVPQKFQNSNSWGGGGGGGGGRPDWEKTQIKAAFLFIRRSLHYKETQ